MHIYIIHLHIAYLGNSKPSRFIVIPSTIEVEYPIINPQLQAPFDMTRKMKPFAPHYVVLNDVAVYRNGDILGEQLDAWIDGSMDGWING